MNGTAETVRALRRGPAAQAAFLAVCPDRERTAFYEDLQAYDPLAWPALREGLDEAVAQHREIGCCTAFGAWQDPVSAIAVAFIPAAACRRWRSIAVRPPSLPMPAS